jgi:acetyl-CoA synthetase
MTAKFPEQGGNDPDAAIWYPSEEQKRDANWSRFLGFANLRDYRELEEKAAANPEWFWEQLISFFDVRFETPYSQICDLSGGIAAARWCVGATMNMTSTLLDRHIEAGRGAHIAVIFEAEDGEVRKLTYDELVRRVDELSRGLVREDVGAGDVVGLFLPMIPEAAIAFLAIARIGAIALPLFSGFGEEALASRLADAGAVAVITAESTPRRGKASAMKATLDVALAKVASVRLVVVAPTSRRAPMQAGRDLWWEEATVPGAEFAPVIVDAEHPLMIVYTSGTTGKPKGTVHTHCGFTVKTAEDYLLAFDLKPADRWMWMSDLGWLVGPIQIVATFMAGATLLLAEGGPDYPQAGRLWRLIQDHRLTIVGLSPTIARLMKNHGAAEVESYDLSSLRAVASTGEPWDLSSWAWIFHNVLRGRGPLMNNIGGTEMGGILATNVLYPIKPTSFFGPIPGTGADILREDGTSAPPGELGELVLKSACIGTTRGLWRDPDRYHESYWSRFPGIWLHGDWASRDEDGYWFIHGRSDDTIKLAGKRTGPAEIEALLLATGKVKDAAAVGIPDPVKGTAIICVVVPAAGIPADPALEELLVRSVTAGLGNPFRPRSIYFAGDLPRTRNLKVMRRVVRAALTGEAPGDLTSLVNPEAYENLRRHAV